MTEAISREKNWTDNFADTFDRLTSEGPQWMRKRRREAMERFEKLGFPTPALEAWKNTNVGPVARASFSPAPRATNADASVLGPAGELQLGGARLVFVDGRYDAELSDTGPESTDGRWIGSLAHALETIPDRIEPLLAAEPTEGDHPFFDLNTALAEDGAVVLVPDGVDLGHPVHLIFATTEAASGCASNPLTLVSAGDGARCRVVETYVGPQDAAYLTNAASLAFIGANARVEHYRAQLEGDDAYHVSWGHSRQQRDSFYRTVAVDLGGQLVRHDLRAVLDGEGGEGQMNGLYIPRGAQHVDNHTSIDHAQPHCDSRELYKGILAGRARSVFNGRIIVREDAQKTDAKQSNPNLLLSDSALAHTRPQLEIYADDVKCTHGATIGRMDEDAIFYLRSRCVPHDKARNLLVSAFADEVLETVDVEPLRWHLERLVEQRLDELAAAAAADRAKTGTETP